MLCKFIFCNLECLNIEILKQGGFCLVNFFAFTTFQIKSYVRLVAMRIIASICTICVGHDFSKQQNNCCACLCVFQGWFLVLQMWYRCILICNFHGVFLVLLWTKMFIGTYTHIEIVPQGPQHHCLLNKNNKPCKSIVKFTFKKCSITIGICVINTKTKLLRSVVEPCNNGGLYFKR